MAPSAPPGWSRTSGSCRPSIPSATYPAACVSRATAATPATCRRPCFSATSTRLQPDDSRCRSTRSTSWSRSRRRTPPWRRTRQWASSSCASVTASEVQDPRAVRTGLDARVFWREDGRATLARPLLRKWLSRAQRKAGLKDKRRAAIMRSHGGLDCVLEGKEAGHRHCAGGGDERGDAGGHPPDSQLVETRLPFRSSHFEQSRQGRLQQEGRS